MKNAPVDILVWAFIKPCAGPAIGDGKSQKIQC